MIFVYRKGSIQPFTKGLPSAQLLDILTDVLVDSDKAGNGVHVKDEASAILQTAVRKARECNEQGTLLRIPYITLFEYLQVLTWADLFKTENVSREYAVAVFEQCCLFFAVSQMHL